MLNAHDAPGYGYYCSFFVFRAFGDQLRLVLVSILLIHSTGSRENVNLCHKNGTKFADAQKTEISVSADGDFGEMKKTETPSKRRRVGR